jgi:DNA-binding LacI/PurR family transcriptional regulator
VPPSLPLPQRALLCDQVAEVLRQGITDGRWGGQLPSEAALCREFQVSRVTLRKAIGQLMRERWVRSGGRGCHHQILRRRSAGAQSQTLGRIVRILTPYTGKVMGVVNAGWIEAVSERVNAAGYRVEMEHHPRLFARHRPEDLRRLDARPDTAAWVLHFSTEPMQRWFAASGRPCVVMGRVHAGIHLPSVCNDTEATGRHGAGLLCARGYRELVYLMAEFTSLNDHLAAEAFAKEARSLGARVRIVVDPAGLDPLRAALDKLLAARPRPTGFFSTCPEHCLAILCHLQYAGLRIPEDAAILSGWDDLCVHYAVPTIAHYSIDDGKAGRKTAMVLLDLLKHGSGKLSTVHILPEFKTGGSLGTWRGAPVAA